jgi:hypothetical protein
VCGPLPLRGRSVRRSGFCASAATHRGRRRRTQQSITHRAFPRNPPGWAYQFRKAQAAGRLSGMKPCRTSVCGGDRQRLPARWSARCRDLLAGACRKVTRCCELTDAGVASVPGRLVEYLRPFE